MTKQKMINSESELYDFQLESKTSTNTTQDSFPLSIYRCYLEDIGRYPMLSDKEEQEIGDIILNGSSENKKEAVTRLVLANLKLVVFIANKYKTSANIMDIIQEGNAGLLHAANLFDYRKGKFSTYAGQWIRNNINRYLEKDNLLYLPPILKKQTELCKNVSDNLLLNGQILTYTNIANKSGLTEERVREIMNYPSSYVCFYDNGLCENGISPVLNILRDTNAVSPELNCIEIELKNFLKGVLNKLPKKEMLVLDALFGLSNDGFSQTLEGVALIYEETFGKKITKEYVRQLKNRALQKIMNDNEIKETLYEYYQELF